MVGTHTKQTKTNHLLHNFMKTIVRSSEQAAPHIVPALPIQNKPSGNAMLALGKYEKTTYP